MELPTDYQNFIYKRTYARWLETEGRRENWDKSVDRYRDFFLPRVPSELKDEYNEAIEAFRNLEAMGAMRALWTAGPALDVDNVAGFNCGYTPIECIKDFAELLYILMNGTGVGVSVERQYINKLPEVPSQLNRAKLFSVEFEDSKWGWASGFLDFLNHMYQGFIPVYDLSKIRPKGARLKTFGGRASGPEPLQELLEFTKTIFLKAEGRRLHSDEVADICCKVAECVVVGGVRRSAILILTNPSDRRMASYKTGEFWIHHPQRVYANISSCYTDTPDAITFAEDWLDLMKSGTGERGIVNRVSLQKTAEWVGRDPYYEFGVNPCGEIILRPKQFCNLTEVVIRKGMTREDAERRIKHAVLLGIVQSTMTNFQFINKKWADNTEEEHLLGVSLTGIMDCPELVTQSALEMLRLSAGRFAKRFAKILDVPTPKAITCVKPSGTVSQLVDSSSGIHPRFSKYYVRRVRVAVTDPICQFMIDEGVPCKPENGDTEDNAGTMVFSFPMKAPDGSVCRKDVSAIDALEVWLKLKKFYTHHNPSATIFVTDNEWMEVGGWVHKNWDFIGGLTFMPFDGGNYRQAPYEEITEAEYSKLAESFPMLDWEALDQYESTDNTIGRTEFACGGGGCEI